MKKLLSILLVASFLFIGCSNANTTEQAPEEKKATKYFYPGLTFDMNADEMCDVKLPDIVMGDDMYRLKLFPSNRNYEGVLIFEKEEGEATFSKAKLSERFKKLDDNALFTYNNAITTLSSYWGTPKSHDFLKTEELSDNIGQDLLDGKVSFVTTWENEFYTAYAKLSYSEEVSGVNFEVFLAKAGVENKFPEVSGTPTNIAEYVKDKTQNPSPTEVTNNNNIPKLKISELYYVPSASEDNLIMAFTIPGKSQTISEFKVTLKLTYLDGRVETSVISSPLGMFVNLEGASAEDRTTDPMVTTIYSSEMKDLDKVELAVSSISVSSNEVFDIPEDKLEFVEATKK